MNDYTLYSFLCAVAIVAVGYLLCSLFSWSLNYDKWNKFSITLKNVLCWIGYVPIALVTYDFTVTILPYILNFVMKFFMLDFDGPRLYLFDFQAKIHQYEVSVVGYICHTVVLLLSYGLALCLSFGVGFILCPSRQIRTKILPIAIVLAIFQIVDLVLCWHSREAYGNVMCIIFELLIILFCVGFSAINETVDSKETETASTSSSEQAYLLVFSASWCEPSKKFIKEINEAGIDCCTYIDVDQEWTEDLFTKYNVSSVPTTILVKTNGEVINKWVGYHGEDPGQSKCVSYIRNCNYSIIPFTKQNTL